MPTKLLLVVFLLCFAAGRLRAQSAVAQLARHYQAGVERLQVPAFQFDYQDNLRRIPEPAQLHQQQAFFQDVQRQLAQLPAAGLGLADAITADHLRYEVAQHLRRLELEQAFRRAGAPVPATGLSALPTPHAWYALYARQYTSTSLTPDELYTFGQQQVRRVQGEIRRLRRQLGYGQDSAGFYRYLASDAFQLRDTAQILRRYRAIEQRVRRHLGAVFADTAVPALRIQPWEDATAAMPPGIYRQGRYDFNFATGRHNTRAMEWIFEHEGIPGHHYQSVLQRRNPSYSPLSSSTFYSGNAEGWGCYVEYLGAQLGLYQQPETELGKWEWDLVRSARVVLDVGIHDRGWTHAQALAYWQANVPGQQDIAEREINRVTTWPAQCLSYKVGAQRIEALKARLSQQPGFSLPRFHAAYLALSGLPLEVVERHFEAVYRRLPARD